MTDANLGPYLPHLDSLNGEAPAMERLVERWASINSGSTHLEGLARMCAELKTAFSVLKADMQEVTLAPRMVVDKQGMLVRYPHGNALQIRKRPKAKKQVLLVGHMDTVFSVDHPFQTVRSVDRNTLNGPGVADLKGGLVVMLKALYALETSPFAKEIGWEIILNPDEEIGSSGSAPLFVEAAQRHDFGLVYEPALADGTLALGRKGSGNFDIVVRGKAAHAGRNPQEGRNAVALLAELTTQIYALNGLTEGITVNPGVVEGGAAVNVVPDLAILRFNVRVGSHEEQSLLEQKLKEVVEAANKKDGFRVEMIGGFTRPPKPVTDAQKQLADCVQQCGVMIEVPVLWQNTGGCCDGNNLAAHGLPNIDTMGVRGGKIHSDQEFVLLDSLVERARLSALILMRYANNDLNWQPRGK